MTEPTPVYGWAVCRALQCNRKVHIGTDYCCAGCRLAWESNPRFDVNGYHSDGCNARMVARGGELRTSQAAVLRSLEGRR